MLQRILENLHAAINKDPQSVPAFRIEASSGTATIQNNILQLSGPSAGLYNLRTYTLGSLADAINQQVGFTATILQPGNLSALVLLEGVYPLPNQVFMFTSFLWQLLQPVALVMLDALGAQNQALLEMVMNTSDGAWLDAFGELFGVYREDGEPDPLYAIRVFDFSVGPRVNNLAIQKTLQDLGYQAIVKDSGNFSFDVNVTLPLAPPQGFFYSNAQIGDMVSLLKAAGTVANIILNGSLMDSVTVSDQVSATLSPSAWTWDAFPGWGNFNWQ